MVTIGTLRTRFDAAVPGREAWRPFELEIGGVQVPFQRQDRAGDWIAFHDLGDECLYVHVQQPDGSTVSIVTITDITPYIEGQRAQDLNASPPD